MSDDSKMICIICHKQNKHARYLLVRTGHGTFAFCYNCINLLHEHMAPAPLKRSARKMPTMDIINELKKYISGQDRAIELISGTIYLHYLAIYNKQTIEKSNVLVIGKSGSGKTYTVKRIAELLNVPCVIVDITSFTEAGYVGEDVESILGLLLSEAGGDISKAQEGIIFLDEIDKIAKRATDGNKDVTGEGVQRGLLKMLQGSKIRFSYKKRNGETIEMDTSNILFICSGAFEPLYALAKKDLNGVRFGLGDQISQISKQSDTYDSVMSKIDIKHLTKFGFMKEFVARFHINIVYRELTKEDYLNILRKKLSPIIELKNLLAIKGIELKYSDEILDIIAEHAVKSDIGARALHARVKTILLPIAHLIDGLPEGSIITITPDAAKLLSHPIIHNANLDDLEPDMH